MVIGWSLLIWPTVVYGKMWYWARAVGSWVTGSTMMDNFWDGMSNFISTDPGMLMIECWSIPVATYSEVNGTRVPTNPVYWVARRTFPSMVTDGAMERALTETEEPEPERNLVGFSRSSASFSVIMSVVFSVRERKMIPVSAPWKNPAPETVSDLRR